jgi:hypothetical protein
MQIICRYDRNLDDIFGIILSQMLAYAPNDDNHAKK